MSTAVLFIISGALALIQIPISTISLWLSGKIVRAAGTTFPTALKIGLVLWALHVAVLAVAVLMRLAMPNDLRWAFFLAIAETIALLAVMLVLVWVFIKRGLKASGKQAAVATVLMFLMNYAIGYGAAIAIRTYFIEAFVVPTGSMATNILGAHSDVICENCGLPFTVGMADRIDGNGGRLRFESIERAQCPNCGQGVDLDEHYPIESGDRILVDKTTAPRRWDCVVYRPPEEPPTNYVHRLVGLAGEKLAICDGDVFIDGTRLVKKPDELTDMWFPVNDTQFVPKHVDNDTPRWIDETEHWKNDGGSWSFNGAGAVKAELSFHGQITDRLAYNTVAGGRQFHEEPTPVGDLRVDCDNVAKLNLDGGVWGFRWVFDGRTVQAEILPGGAIHLTVDFQNQANIGALPARSATGRYTPSNGSNMGFAIRDGFAYVLQNGRPCATLQIGPSKLADVVPSSKPVPGQLSIYADNRGLEIGRIQISRDVYYTQPSAFTGRSPPNPFSVQLQKDELFVLGDNSTNARDSRYQDKPVPSQGIVGVARWRYWPFSRWHTFQ